MDDTVVLAQDLELIINEYMVWFVIVYKTWFRPGGDGPDRGDVGGRLHGGADGRQEAGGLARRRGDVRQHGVEVRKGLSTALEDMSVYIAQQ